MGLDPQTVKQMGGQRRFVRELVFGHDDLLLRFHPVGDDEPRFRGAARTRKWGQDRTAHREHAVPLRVRTSRAVIVPIRQLYLAFRPVQVDRAAAARAMGTREVDRLRGIHSA